MTDKELLERCAKVMGIKGEWYEPGQCIKLDSGPLRWVKLWNPLTSVADAADMAIKMKVDVVWHHSEVWATQKGKGVAIPFKDHPTEQAAYCYAVCSVVAQMGGE